MWIREPTAGSPFCTTSEVPLILTGLSVAPDSAARVQTLPLSYHFLLTYSTRSLSTMFVHRFARVASRAATRTTMAAPRQSFRRWYSSEPTAQKSSSWLYLTGAAAAGGLGFWYYTATGAPSAASKTFTPAKADYQAIYNEIADRLEEKDDYDDGSFGPVLLRLAWHASGTYDKVTGTGGSNGATMRFAPESDHGANAGLVAARDFLEPVKGTLRSLYICKSTFADKKQPSSRGSRTRTSGSWGAFAPSKRCKGRTSRTDLAVRTATWRHARRTAACRTRRRVLTISATSFTGWASTTRKSWR